MAGLYVKANHTIQAKQNQHGVMMNQALMRLHHALKTVDDMLSDVSGTKVLSKLDTKSGFWHIRLDKKSSY